MKNRVYNSHPIDKRGNEPDIVELLQMRNSHAE